MKPFCTLTLLALLALGGAAAAQDGLPSVPLATPRPTPLPFRTPLPYRTPAPAAPAATPVALPQTPPPAIPGMAQQGGFQLPAQDLPVTPSATPTPPPSGTSRKTKAATPSGNASVKSKARSTRRGSAGQGQSQKQGAAPSVAGAETPAVPMLPPLSDAPAPAAGKPAAQKPEINVDIAVKLERIRVQRAQTFATLKNEPETELIDDPAAWSSEMAMQMRLTPPRDWDVLDVTEAGFQQALDQTGQLLPSLRTIGAPNATAPVPDIKHFAPSYRKSGNGATLILRTTPPAAIVHSFKELTTHICTTLGYRRPLKVSDVRNKLGASIMRNSGVDDVAIQVTDVANDNIDLMALGEIGRIGDITFEDAATGKTINPYNAESSLKEAPPVSPNTPAKQAKEWRFSFTKLPPRVNMIVTLYSKLMPRVLTVTFKDVPLP